jgi:hypothetical protein
VTAVPPPRDDNDISHPRQQTDYRQVGKGSLDRLPDVIQPIFGWLHCGMYGDQTRKHQIRIIQLITGWLHCGYQALGPAKSITRLIQPITGGPSPGRQRGHNLRERSR